ncbi:hypothetical protein [Marilutibacter spongiae]|uniref:Uncharacterized protein n=1 Tax=Marilutibacter spongiae TaxID=2025720 RepID=A0A7W3Y7D0_9GAMM|nr:hypothetical protein [Lysobacter spongiae]MBB1061950.1 hypothetical protein [Lysobacter spongiae]
MYSKGEMISLLKWKGPGSRSEPLEHLYAVGDSIDWADGQFLASVAIRNFNLGDDDEAIRLIDLADQVSEGDREVLKAKAFIYYSSNLFSPSEVLSVLERVIPSNQWIRDFSSQVARNDRSSIVFQGLNTEWERAILEQGL